MKHLFRLEERNAVEDKFGDDLLFEAMSVPCRSLMSGARTFALHPSELFYHVLFTIDDIKSKSIEKATVHCDKALWDDLLEHLRDRVGDEYYMEAQQATGMIMYVAALTLIWSGNPIYTSISGVLIKRVEEHIPDFSDTLYQKFTEGFSTPDGNELRQSINDYLESGKEISIVIEELLDNIPNTDFGQQHEEKTTLVKIAPRRITSVIVVLEAMYKAGWFVDANGKPLSNRDEAIAHILKVAFGEKNANVTQLLNSVKNRNKGKDKNGILSELINQE